MEKKQVISVGLIVLLCSLLISYAWSAIATGTGSEQVHTKVAKECRLKIEGMNCPICAARIKKGLKDLVISSEIDVEKGIGRFVCAEGTSSCKGLTEKITEMGFEATTQTADQK